MTFCLPIHILLFSTQVFSLTEKEKRSIATHLENSLDRLLQNRSDENYKSVFADSFEYTYCNRKYPFAKSDVYKAIGDRFRLPVDSKLKFEIEEDANGVLRFPLNHMIMIRTEKIGGRFMITAFEGSC